MNKYKVTFKEICKFHVVVEAEDINTASVKAYEIYDYNPPDTIEVEEMSIEKVEGEEACTITQ